MYLPGKRKDNCIAETAEYHKSVPFVLEFGGLTTRAGYAGYETPTVQIPTEFAIKDDNTIQLLDFSSPKGVEGAEIGNFLSQGNVVNWEQASSFIELLAKNHIGMDPKETPLFFVEAALTGKESRQKCVEAVFETMNFNSLFIHKAPVLSSYVVAKETLLLIDSGAYSTYVVPIVEGYINQKGVIRSDVAGEYLTQRLGKIWTARQNASSFSCFANQSSLRPSMQQWGSSEVVREIKLKNIKLKDSHTETLSKFNYAVDAQIFELPDKQKLEILSEMYEVPELLFNPIPEENYMGLQDLIKQSIERVDSENRRELLNNIMVIGGNSMITNMVDRLQREIHHLEISTSGRVKLFSTATLNERAHSSWVGGSIVASMRNFDNLLMTKKDYEEHGPVLIERKVLF